MTEVLLTSITTISICCSISSSTNIRLIQTIPQIIANSIAALDAFENARRNGANVPMAEAEAISVLFSNIGESEYNTVSELILENFGDTIDLDSEIAVEYWTNQVMTDIPDLFDGVDRMAIGVDALDLELMETEIVGRIVIYLSDNGLQ